MHEYIYQRGTLRAWRSYVCCSRRLSISNIIENPIMHLTNGYISIMHAAYAQAFFLFRDVYTLIKASSPISISTRVHQDFGSWTDRVLRMDRWIDCSFRVTQLLAVRLFGALSSRVDLQNFNVHRSPISFSLFLLRRYVYIHLFLSLSLFPSCVELVDSSGKVTLVCTGCFVF